MLTREGGHRADRIVHAGGDATGAEVQRALHAAVRRDPWIRLVEHALVLDLLRAADGRACGVTLHVLGEGSEDGVGAILARAVVLATGGMGQVFASTTNPAVSTGDGVALALRAGAVVTDVEFVQFHPTVVRHRRASTLGAAAAGLRGAARRGRLPGRRRRQAVHGRPARAGRAGAARRGRQGHPPGAAGHRRRPRLPGRPPPGRRVPRAALPDDRRVLPGGRRRPGRPS